MRTRHTAAGLIAGVSLAAWLALGCESDGGSKPPQSNGAAANGGTTGTPGNGGSAGVGATASADSPLLPARIRRLTNAEYDASVQALLGTTATPSVTFAFPPDTRQGPTNSPAGAAFTVNDAQRVDPVLADKLDAAAQALVAEALMHGKLAALAPCSDPTLQGEQCAQTFLRSFGRSAYRRPLSDEEVAFLTVGPAAAYHVGADGYAYEDGIGLLLRVILQQPAFLYTTELGVGGAATFDLTQDEIATALSYLLTSAPPDAPLQQRAAAGELATPELREAEAKRLLASAAGRVRLVRVVQEWLGIDQVARREKAASVYPQFANIAQALEDESRAFIDEVLNHSTGTLSELLTANFTMADAKVAEFYGVPWGGAGQRTSLASVKRRGILNQGAFLSVFASNNGSHPVFRGVALMRRVACLDTPDPGALGIVVSLPAADPQKTTRERFQVHTTDPGCAGCHTTIDAFGFALESFDGIGQWRTSENGRPVDTTVTLGSGSELDGTYADSSDLLAALARSSAVKSCLARQLFRTSAARSDASVSGAEQAFVDVWQQLPATEQDRLADVLVAFVKSPSFIRRRLP